MHMLRKLARPFSTKVFDYSQMGRNWAVTCGNRQSPIDFVCGAFTDSSNMDINFNYNILKKAKLENVGYTLKLKGNLGSVTAFNGDFKETYHGEEFHFHNPSEHTFNGMHYPLEMHIVHKSKSQGIEDTHCVLAIYFQLTSEKNDFLSTLNLKDLSEIESLNLHGFVEKVGTKSMYMYKGSLTTPPCTECVQWVSLNNAQNISEEQLHLFKEHLKMHNQLPNARGICPICNRIIHRKV